MGGYCCLYWFLPGFLISTFQQRLLRYQTSFLWHGWGLRKWMLYPFKSTDSCIWLPFSPRTQRTSLSGDSQSLLWSGKCLPVLLVQGSDERNYSYCGFSVSPKAARVGMHLCCLHKDWEAPIRSWWPCSALSTDIDWCLSTNRLSAKWRCRQKTSIRKWGCHYLWAKATDVLAEEEVLLMTTQLSLIHVEMCAGKPRYVPGQRCGYSPWLCSQYWWAGVACSQQQHWCGVCLKSTRG